MYINDRGQKVLQGALEIHEHLARMIRLREARKKKDPDNTKCMDFDGVLSYHETGSGIDHIGKPLPPGIKKAKSIVKSGKRLVILTARPKSQHKKIKDWLEEQGVCADEVTNVKPPADEYIDDRATHWPRNKMREARKLHYHTTFQDLPVSVENRKGSVRSGEDQDGEEWRTKMKVPYGYIPGTEGVDGDELDVFVGPNEDAAFAYIVHCNTPDGEKFDEDKIMLGFNSKKAAKKCFLQHYDDASFFGGIDEIPMWKFREKAFVKKHTTKKLVASRRMSEPPFASAQLPEDYFAKPEYESGMKKSLLGRNIMKDPRVREHGVQGQKWGVRHSRPGAATTNVQKTMYKGLQDDPRTMSMMQVVSRTQPQLNMIAQAQKDRAAKQAAQQLQQNEPIRQKTPEEHNQELKDLHQEALDHLSGLGWKVLGVGARLTGTDKVLEAVHSIVESPAGKKMYVSSNKNGSHKLSTPRKARASMRTSESRRFLKEAKVYFARSFSHYGTESEDDSLDSIEESFPGDRVVFPKTKRHAELGMGFFHKKINAAKRVVVKPRKRNRLTAGVFSEVRHALKKHKPVYAIHRGKMRRVHSVEALGNPNKEGLFGRLVFKKKK